MEDDDLGKAARGRDLDVVSREAVVALIGTEVRRSLRYGRPLSLLLISLDRLDVLRDAGGDPAVERVLCRSTGLISKVLRESDQLIRGEDEIFTVLLPETSVTRAAEVGERLMHTIGAIGSEGMSVSIGIAAFSPRLADADALLEAALKELTRASVSSGNSIAINPPPKLTPTISNNGKLH